MEPKALNKLVQSALKGNHKAFNRIMDFYGGNVYGYLLKLVRKKEEAEDIFQEVWLKVYRNLSQYQLDQAFEPWLITVARNAAYDYLRAQKRLPEPTEEIAKAYSHVEEDVIEAERKRAIDQAIHQLNDRDRELILLRYMLELAYVEIGDRMGMDVREVKWRLYEAKQKLKHVMMKEVLLWIAN